MITWLASYPKSGNTWVRILLNGYFNGGWIDINRLPWGAGDNRRYPYISVSPVNYESLTRDDIICLRPAALMNLAASIAQKPMLVKTHHAYGSINDIHLFPKHISKRAFYMLRDPREVAPSLASHLKLDLDQVIEAMKDEQYTIGENEQQFHLISSWSNHVKSWLQHKDFPVHVIKYANLKKDPGSVLANILDRIGFEKIDHNLIDKVVENTQLEKLKAQEKAAGFEESPEGNDFFGGKREILTGSQKLQIENDHAEVMELVAL